jgi:hypothetical protein
MLKIRMLAASSAICVLAQIGFAEEAKEAQTPPQIFYLEAGGKKLPVELDKPFATSAIAANETATLRVSAYRLFPYAGLRFFYPQDFTFAANLDDPDVSIWTMRGSDSLIMVQRYPNQPDAAKVQKEMLGVLATQYQGGIRKQTDATLALKSTQLKGVSLDITLGIAQLRQELFAFPSGKDVIILLLQDTPQANGQPSPQRVKVEKILSSSLQLPKK